MERDAFPTTMHTWIDQQLADPDRGRANINRHVMEVYAWPLTIYFRGTRDRWLGEPEEIVQGFFADRLDRPDFLTGWRASGLLLRRWLMNAFCFYLAELRRKHRRDSHADEPDDVPAVDLTDPEGEMDRAFVVTIVRQAMNAALESCADAGLAEHWRIFVLHHYSGKSYQTIAANLSITPARAAVMSRTAGRKFKGALRELLNRDGATLDGIDDEIQSLLEVTCHA